MAYIPENLEKWSSEDPAVGGANNYMGERYDDYYRVIMRTRDSDILVDSNFETVKKALEGLEAAYTDERDYAYVLDIRTGHWAVGWFETIMVHENAPDDILRTADEMVAAVSEYPILDEEDYYQREREEKEQSWDNWGKDESISKLNLGNYVEFLEDNDLVEYEKLIENLRKEYLRNYEGDSVRFEDFEGVEINHELVEQMVGNDVERALSSGLSPEWSDITIDWGKVVDLADSNGLAYRALTLDINPSEEVEVSYKAGESEAWMLVNRFMSEAKEYIRSIYE